MRTTSSRPQFNVRDALRSWREEVVEEVHATRCVRTRFDDHGVTVAGVADVLNHVTLHDNIRERGWAKGNLSDAEIALYDSAISEANIPLAKMLLTAIHSRFVAENGAEGRMVEGKRAPTNAGARGFESTEQAVAFVRDPRYQSDPAYRREFMERVKASKPGILG